MFIILWIQVNLMDSIRYMISPLPTNPNEFNTVYIPELADNDYSKFFDVDIQEQENGGVIMGIKLWKR